MKTNSIKVNNREILVFSEGQEKYVAIKPICEAIGVDYSNQVEKINNDEILSQLSTLRGVVGADNRSREMRVIPLRYMFGWLFTINANKVRPEIKKQMIAYKMECYNALFDMFTKRTAILKEKSGYQIEIERIEAELRQDPRYKKVQDLKASVSAATKRLNSMDKDFFNEQLDLFKDGSI